MIEAPLIDSLDEAWHSHISAAIEPGGMQSEEYRDRQMDYLSGAYDVLSVLGTQLMRKTNGGKKPLTAPILIDTFYQLFEDTQEQHYNLVDLLGRGIENAQSDIVVDDKPQPV